MVSLLRDSQCDLVIDATHPYAELVTDHVANACKMVGVEYVRVVRRESATDGCVLCRDVAEVVAFLNSHPGPIFLTTGSKLLPELTSVEQYGERCTVRILPNGVENAVALGYRPEKIIGAQGPFSVEENVAQMKAHHTSILVTKESGAVGGFPEKLAAAKALGVTVVVLCRPTDETGVSVAELKHRLEAWT
jgi:precorrin-6x reductase